MDVHEGKRIKLEYLINNYKNCFDFFFNKSLDLNKKNCIKY